MPSVQTAVAAGANGASFATTIGPGRAHHPARVIVRFHPGKRDFLPGSGRARGFAAADLFVVDNPPGLSVAEALMQYRRRPAVRYAEPDFAVRTTATPDDPYFSQQWGMSRISAPAAWATQTLARDVVVAIVDTGVDFAHPDLARNLDPIHSFTCINGPCASGGQDDNGHGSHVAGVIGAVSNNGAGVAGVNWDVVMISLKFLDSSGTGFVSDAITAMNKLAELRNAGLNIRVANDSWGSAGYSQALKDAMAELEPLGIVSVCAAGNNGLNADTRPDYPAGYDNRGIVSVMATDSNDAWAGFSNFGLAAVDIAAPGVNILSTVPAGTCQLCDATGYTSLSGTSMAAPFVSGVLAALFHVNPSLSAAQARDVVLDPGSYDPMTNAARNTSSGGRLNFAKALANPRLSNPGPLNSFPVVSTGANVFAGANWTVNLSAAVADADPADAANMRVQWSNPVNGTNTWLLGWMAGRLFPAPNGPRFTFSAPALARAAVVPYDVSAADNRGGGAQGQQVVTVAPSTNPGLPPSVSFSLSFATATSGQSIAVNAPVSDPEGTATAWALSVSGMQGAYGWCCFTSSSTAVTFNSAGVYRVAVQAIDSELNVSARPSAIVSVDGATGVPPIVDAKVDKISGTAPLTVNIDLSGSYDPDGAISQYFVGCERGYAGGSTSPRGSCTYNLPGSYWIQLTVMDDSGLVDVMPLYVVATPPGVASDSDAPAVWVTAPAPGTVVSGPTAVSVAASDSVSGVAKVDFRLDDPVSGVLIGSDATAPYGVTWDPSGASAGGHILYAIAADNAGNVGITSVEVSVARCASNPTVTVDPATATIATGSSKAFVVTVVNNDAASCGSSTFGLSVSQPTGVTASLSRSSVTLAPGASATASLTETAGVSPGVFPIAIKATNTAPAGSYGTANATLTVAACSLSAPTIVLNSAGPIAANAGTEVAVNATVKNNNSAACPVATFKLAVTKPSGWTAALTPSSVSIAPGATASAVLTVATGSAGAYTVTVKATNAASASNSAVGGVQFNVAQTTVVASTDNPAYKPKSVVRVRGTVAGYTPISGATVTFTVRRPNGASKTVTAVTGSEGVAVASYTLLASDPNGTYTVEPSAVVGKVAYKGAAISFVVAP